MKISIRIRQKLMKLNKYLEYSTFQTIKLYFIKLQSIEISRIQLFRLIFGLSFYYSYSEIIMYFWNSRVKIVYQL
jgi:hypothetical protein